MESFQTAVLPSSNPVMRDVKVSDPAGGQRVSDKAQFSLEK